MKREIKKIKLRGDRRTLETPTSFRVSNLGLSLGSDLLPNSGVSDKLKLRGLKNVPKRREGRLLIGGGFFRQKTEQSTGGMRYGYR
jgi:hypothetical protein